MKDNSIFLHPSKMKSCVLIIFTAAIISLIFALVIFYTKPYFSQLSSIINSTYLYSAETREAASNDCYIAYNAEIGFSLYQESSSTIFASSIMQLKNEQYTDVISWNAQILEPDSVAISKNLARKYALNIGDALYSKHIVTGTICEYGIVEIIPDIINTRMTENCIEYDGIIIMGYDKSYDENIDHSYLAFSKNGFADTVLKEIGAFKNIVYRKNEIHILIQCVLPYMCISLLLMIFVASFFIWYMANDVKKNYFRLMTLGFSLKKIETSFIKAIYYPNIVLVLALLTIFILVCAIIGVSRFLILWVALLILVELLTLLIAGAIVKKRFWR